MVALEWTAYVELMYHNIKEYEYSPDSVSAAMDYIETLNTRLFASQRWIRRGMATSMKIRHVIQFLLYHKTNHHNIKHHDDTNDDANGQAALLLQD